MADLKSSDSAYDTGSASTHTDLVNNVDTADADHVNHVASGVLAIEAILGTGTTLKGTAADLATRLDIPLETSGKLKDFSATNKTTFPISVAEGGTNAATFSASEIIRRNASTQTLESTGYTVPGSSGVMVSEGDTQTLTAKTLTTPTIGDYTNGQHDHTNAAGGGVLTQSALGANSVGTSQLKLSTGNSGALTGPSTQSVTINRYAFGSLDADAETSGTGLAQEAIYGVHSGGTDTQRRVKFNFGGSERFNWTWDYITSSENPSIWANVAPDGTIFQCWESEDPADPDFPEEPPIDSINGSTVVQITQLLLHPTFLDTLIGWKDSHTTLPKWHKISKWKNTLGIQELHQQMFNDILVFHGKKELLDIRDVRTESGLTDQHKIWRFQLWARNLSRIIYEHKAFTLSRLIEERFKLVGAKGPNPTLEVK